MSRPIRIRGIMTADGFAPGILSDIAASLFAVLLLVLMLVFGHDIAGHGRRPPAGSIAEIMAERDLEVVERQVESPAAMIEQLRWRVLGSADRPPIVELHRDTVEVVAPETGSSLALAPTADMVPRLKTIMSGSPPGTTIALFVFAGDLYQPVRDIIAAAGHPMRELSVPQALRCRGAQGRADDWCAAFLALARVADSPSAFRDALAQLLAGSAGSGWHHGTAFEGGAVAPLEMLEQWWARLFMALTWPALCAALCFLAVAETNGKYQ
jgi:hypothetical protein